jgi:hypothetical protein
MLRILVLVAVLVGLGLLAWSRRGGQINMIEAGKGTIGSLEGDQQVLEQMRKAGADLTKPTDVIFYLYFKDRQAADSAAAHAGEGPLVATVQRAADDSAWLCLVRGEMVPTEAAIHAHAVRLLALAQAHGGEYDGWEAAVVK